MPIEQRYIIILTILIGIIAIGFIAYQPVRSSDGRLRIKDFNPGGVCAALTPDCGYCPGHEQHEGCWVTEKQLETYRSYDSDVEIQRRFWP